MRLTAGHSFTFNSHLDTIWGGEAGTTPETC